MYNWPIIIIKSNDPTLNNQYGVADPMTTNDGKIVVSFPSENEAALLDTSEVLDFFQTFKKISRENGVTRQKNINLLLEGYRRFMMFNNGGKTLGKAWVGLGSPSTYKSPYFTVSGKEIPRVNNWYTFSEKGAEIMETILQTLPIPTNPLIVDKLNNRIFTI